ncbi:hypothetical protein FA13DRAFT_1732867 [Coprinellus micaceus]|uniref:Uncharacterized protein n=1 Tax=Coprinellus micaceus TaxID=71717 RepID=A0A4Y7TBX3_COPMI|nr:hypothetical protein FA13DRAFT_1732867 [Coprinellus micaceus]
MGMDRDSASNARPPPGIPIIVIATGAFGSVTTAQLCTIGALTRRVAGCRLVIETMDR